ncbi:MAG: hypothetical protein WCW13_02895 [archaeon]|jgi:hypothetical protein
MPTKRLPKKLVRKLRAYKKAGVLTPPLLGQMENIDHRKNHPQAILDALRLKFLWETADHPGARVRQMNISRNYPKMKKGRHTTELVLKRVHEGTAKEIIAWAKNTAKALNKSERYPSFVFVPPTAYPIGKDILAMPKVYLPTAATLLKDFMGHENSRVFWNNLRKKDEQKWWRAYNQRATDFFAHELFDVYTKTGYDLDDLLVVGFKGNKIVLMLLPDKASPKL